MQKIYVLKCEDDKYYVGKTSNVDRRFAEHLTGNGSEWTRDYPPVRVIEQKNEITQFDEMTKTLEYMKRYGIDHVRGAQWSNINLTLEQRTEIGRAMNTDACFHCGETGHFSSNCTNRNRSLQSVQTIQCYQCRNYGHYANECNNNRKTVRCCERCGRDSHVEDDCYATYDIDGVMLDCARCRRDTHCADECYAKTDIDGRRLYS